MTRALQSVFALAVISTTALSTPAVAATRSISSARPRGGRLAQRRRSASSGCSAKAMRRLRWSTTRGCCAPSAPAPIGSVAVCYFEWSGVVSQKGGRLDRDRRRGIRPRGRRLPDDGAARLCRPHVDRRRDRILDGQARAAAVTKARATPSTSRATAPKLRPRLTFARDARSPRASPSTASSSSAPSRCRGIPFTRNPPGGLDNYLPRQRDGRAGAFTMVVEDFNSFGQAIVNKLIREIAHRDDRRRDDRRHAALR